MYLSLSVSLAYSIISNMSLRLFPAFNTILYLSGTSTLISLFRGSVAMWAGTNLVLRSIKP
nr:MAG TPA: hypothetical protein [Caudoviricetes sp.]